MGHYILLEYLRENPENESSVLSNIYAYFKFKAYLQTTLRCTRKSYCIKQWNAALNMSFLPPHELCLLSDSKTTTTAVDPPNDVEWAIKQLEPGQAEIIILYFYYDKTDLEISCMKSITRQAVNNTRRRALNRLRELLVNK
ncbi:MAG: hypothetical protein LBI42_14210 [Chitinispirillales bacterium]|nr:hypothetical protein [Chitinispirillales bacterium]